MPDTKAKIKFFVVEPAFLEIMNPKSKIEAYNKVFPVYPKPYARAHGNLFMELIVFELAEL